MTTKQKNKEIQLSLNISDHDMQRKANQVLKFREKGMGVNINLRLRKFEQGRSGDAMLRMNQFISISETPERKVGPMKWNGSTLHTFLHP